MMALLEIAVSNQQPNVPSQLRYDASRAIAKQMGKFPFSETLSDMDVGYALTPSNLRTELQCLGSYALQLSLHAVLQRSAAVPITEVNLRKYFGMFVDDAVSDSIAGVLSIGSMPKRQAMAIVSDRRSLEAVHTLAMSGTGETLAFPEGVRPSDADSEPDELLMYNDRLGYITTSAGPNDTETSAEPRGCPIARNRGRLVEDLFLNVATATIEHVEWPAGTHFFTDSADINSLPLYNGINEGTNK